MSKLCSTEMTSVVAIRKVCLDVKTLARQVVLCYKYFVALFSRKQPNIIQLVKCSGAKETASGDSAIDQPNVCGDTAMTTLVTTIFDSDKILLLVA